MNQKIFKGAEGIENLERELLKISPKKILLVRGKDSFTKSGADKIIYALAEKLGSEMAEFKEFSANPEYSDVMKGLKFVKDFNPDLFIAIGGGSVMDMAKTLRFLDAYEGDLIKEEFSKTGNLKPLVAIPMTAGTGSEATKFAILYKDKVKYSVDHPDALPEMVVLLPQLTESNPSYLTACCGFDAFAQAIEALWNRFATEESDEYARKALKLLAPNIKKAVNYPDPDIREKMLEGAFWAGKAINITRTTAPHAFAYVFTSYYNYPHGHAVALTFPAVAEINLNSGAVSKEKTDFILETCGISLNNIREDLEKFRDSIGLGIKNCDYDKNLILGGINAGRLKNNPVEIDKTKAGYIVDCATSLTN